ncbi:amino acid permease-domain-containing protein [Hyaloscypha sp. PMI_1271]|nr:amino acid permease-domain-containing protein [Hyaloscypha sp. PMI_1271]
MFCAQRLERQRPWLPRYLQTPRTPEHLSTEYHLFLSMDSHLPSYELQTLPQARSEGMHSQSSTESDDIISEQSHDVDVQDAAQQTRQDPTKELTKAPKESDLLGRLHIFCIIANRMIGTGIFDGATFILEADQNVGGSLMLWVLGAITAFAGTLMYIEYGLTIPRMQLRGRGVSQPVPRSGGELNYLVHIFNRPRYLAACMFGWVFILIGNSAANCILFTVHVLAAAGISSPHTGLVQVIAIAVAWSILLIHSLGRMFGVHLNTAFAIAKIAILFLIIILGFIVLNNHTIIHRNPGSYANLDWKTSFKDLKSNSARSPRGYPTAFLSILFTYAGFNQANYVLGEIRKPVRIFRSAALWSVGIISILYLVVGVAYMIVVPLPRRGEFPSDFSVIGEFFKLTIGKAWTERNALVLMNTFLAVSSLGNVIVTTFTAARVKQEIAKEGVLPYSLLLSRNVNIMALIRKALPKISHAQQAKIFSEPIPFPALCLHGVFTTFLILGTFRTSHTRDSYPFIVGVYTYTIDAIIAVLLSSGLIVMRLRPSSKWNEDSLTDRWLSLSTAVLVLLANLFPVIASWIPALQPKFGSSIPWFVVPTMGWALVISGFCYWLVFRYIWPMFKSGAVLSVTRTPLLHEDDEGNVVQQGELVQQSWEVPVRTRRIP